MALKAFSFIFALAFQGAVAMPALNTTFATGKLAQRVRNLIRDWPTCDNNIAGGVLRLSFHDCAGDACDGCVNTSLPENVGLELPVAALEWLYGDMKLANVMSRADLWAFAGTVVVVDAIRKNKPAITPPTEVNLANFKWGRTDCNTAPASPTEKSAYFPSATIGSSAVRDYFQARFSFSPDETVAIMGAHHIGRMHDDYSGYIGAFAASGGALDGSYYATLMNQTENWHQKVVNCSDFPSELKVQWVDNRRKPTLNMLNTDMGLYKDIGTPHSTGFVSCTYESCPFSSTKQKVEEFAGSKLSFVGQFAKVFDKMIRVCSRNPDGSLIYSNGCPLNSMVP